MSRWKHAKSPRKCTTFPEVWAAIVGCDGKGTAWRYTIGHFGREAAEFACPTCQAAQDKLEALQGPAHQSALRALREAAGIVDAYIAEVATVGGRPVLTGKVDRGAVEQLVESFAHSVGDAARAARAILALGGDCRAMVARHCSAEQRAELAAAYRAAKAAAPRAA